MEGWMDKSVHTSLYREVHGCAYRCVRYMTILRPCIFQKQGVFISTDESLALQCCNLQGQFFNPHS